MPKSSKISGKCFYLFLQAHCLHLDSSPACVLQRWTLGLTTSDNKQTNDKQNALKSCGPRKLFEEAALETFVGVSAFSAIGSGSCTSTGICRVELLKGLRKLCNLQWWNWDEQIHTNTFFPGASNLFVHHAQNIGSPNSEAPEDYCPIISANNSYMCTIFYNIL